MIKKIIIKNRLSSSFYVDCSTTTVSTPTSPTTPTPIQSSILTLFATSTSTKSHTNTHINIITNTNTNTNINTNTNTNTNTTLTGSCRFIAYTPLTAAPLLSIGDSRAGGARITPRSQRCRCRCSSTRLLQLLQCRPLHWLDLDLSLLRWPVREEVSLPVYLEKPPEEGLS